MYSIDNRDFNKKFSPSEIVVAISEPPPKTQLGLETGVLSLNTLRELIFAVFADLGLNRKIKFPQNFSNAKIKGRIIHRTVLIFF